MNFMSGSFSVDHQITRSSEEDAATQQDTTQQQDHNQMRGVQVGIIEREHMFDKVVTPSDVGKLNRLVIPKQHAEKYFPLDTSTNEKGLLLNFEDRNGKPWRFRYSYWNSSQSYVMTKGWSRFVKDKKLDAGDIVSFQRGIGDLGKDRLFIDWRRRPDVPADQFPSHQFSFNRSIHPWNPLFLQPPPPLLSREYSHFLSGHGPYSYNNNNNTTVVNGNPCPPGSILYVRSAVGVGGGGGAQQMENQRRSEMVYESVPVVKGGKKAAAAKRLRLFGVNMDCPVSDSDEHMLSQHSTVPFEQLTQPLFDTSSSSSSCLSPTILQLRPYNQSEDKGKGSMSLDLDI